MTTCGEDRVLEALLVRQEQAEAEGLAAGAALFREKLAKAESKGQGSRIGAARSLLRQVLQPMTDALKMLSAQAVNTRGPTHLAIRWAEMVGFEETAYLCVKTVLDHIHQTPTLRDAGIAVGTILADEMRHRRFKEQCPGLYRYYIRYMKENNSSAYNHVNRVLIRASTFATHKDGTPIDLSDVDLALGDRLIIGTKLIGILIETTGIISLEKVYQQKRSKRRGSPSADTILVPAEHTLSWLTQRNECLEWLHPSARPMLVPPLDWELNQRGGYRFGLLGKHPMIRGHRPSEAESRDMPEVRAALNALQQTAWTINPDILPIVQEIFDRGLSLGGVAEGLEDEPPKPQDIATNTEARRRWRKWAGRVKNQNRKRYLRRLEVSRLLDLARHYQHDTFHFPFSCDFRGRIYPIADRLSPQGDDLNKALLCFADAKPLGDDGAVYLALHGASKLDTTHEGRKFSTMTLQERVTWIQQHTGEIEDAARDPLVHHWWTRADKPLQFLAFCFEWAGFAEAYRRGAGADYRSRLAVAQDGSCNGVQHFSALFRDAVGGRATNLYPDDQPHDLYGLVANDVLDGVARDAGVASDAAPIWLGSGLINRKLTKRPTMTFGYGSRTYGFAEQLDEYLRSLENWTDIKALFAEKNEAGKDVDGTPGACRYLAGVIWDALRTRVVAAFEGMEWLRACALALIPTGKPIVWTVPGTEFRVEQAYYQVRRHRIRTMIAGQITSPSYYTDTSTIRRDKMLNGIAPNLIHSLDAAVLMLTVNTAVRHGIGSFSMVHDSYATHAADAAMLAKLTRETFVAFYEQYDPIELFRAEWQEQAPDGVEMPEPPKKGELDIRGVLESDYFFS